MNMIKLTKAEVLLREIWDKLYTQNPDAVRYIDADTEQQVLKYLNRKLTPRKKQQDINV